MHGRLTTKIVPFPSIIKLITNMEASIESFENSSDNCLLYMMFGGLSILDEIIFCAFHSYIKLTFVNFRLIEEFCLGFRIPFFFELTFT